MHRLFLFAIVVISLVLQAKISNGADEARRVAKANRIEIGPADWPWWRGPSRNGLASAEQRPPLHWNDSKNVLWKSPVSGRGHGSPTVMGEQVFLAIADHQREIQAVICYERLTGKQLWETVVHQGGLRTKGNKKATLASSTVACDGQHLFINFLNNGAVYTTALNRDGRQIWQTKISDYIVHQGYGSSPAVYQSLVIVSADSKAGGAIAALDRANGHIVWKNNRPKLANYTSPIILPVAGRDQLLFSGCDLVSSFKPLSGNTIWEIKGSTTECVTSVVSDGELIYTSGGFPKNHISAVRGDGSGEIVWEKKIRAYVPSMLVNDKHLYAVLDSGIATCWKCDNGQQLWKSRLGGKFSSSPIFVGTQIYVTNETGKTYIFKATPAAFKLVAENQLGDEAIATPAICGSRIYTRVAFQNGNHRQEMLYCLGERD